MKKSGKLLAAAAIGAAAVLTVSCGSRKEEAELRKTAIQQLDGGDYEGAISTFDMALQEGNGRVGEMELDILKYRAEAEYKAGDCAAASHTWDILIEVDGEQPEYLYSRSISKAGEGKIDQALADYEAAAAMDIQMDRDVFGREDALLAVGKALEEAGQTDRASQLYEKALEEGVGGGSAQVLNALAVSLMESGNYEEALSFLEKGIATGDEAVMADLLFNQAAAYEYMSQYEKALELFQAYEAAYGPDEAAQKEIIFLSTR